MRNIERNRIHKEFEHLVENSIITLKYHITDSIQKLKFILGLFKSSQEVTREEFHEFVSPYLLYEHSIQAVEWLPCVPDSLRTAYEQRAQKEGFPQFKITELNDYKIAQARHRPMYYPIYYIEPYKGNEQRLGFDLASSKLQRSALNLSRDTGQMVATPKLSIFQKNPPNAFKVILPFYKKDSRTDSIENRRKNLEGFIVGVLYFDKLIERSISLLTHQNYHFTMHDITVPDENTLLFDNFSTGIDKKMEPENFRYKQLITLAQRKCLIECTLPRAFINAQRSWEPYGILFTGLFITGLLCVCFIINISSESKLRIINAHLATEIDERKEVEEKISNIAKFPSENPNPVLRISVEGSILYSNKVSDPLLKVLGCETSNLISEFWYQFVQESFKSRQNRQTEVVCGERVYVLTFAPIMDHNYVNVYAFDITRQKNAEENLSRYADLLEKVNLELDSFVYTASHDLKTPLRSILSFIDLLEKKCLDKLDDQGKFFVERIHRAGSHMDRLIHDLLSLSRISRIQNPYEDTDIPSLINSIKERFITVEGKKTDIKIQENIPTIHCDRIKMGEVFLNLINNSIKFSSKISSSQIAVEVGYIDRNDAHQFCVKDYGIGIDPQYHRKIFDLFERLHPDGEYEGTGAGLNIVKRIIEGHRGMLWIDSEIGKGTTVYFTIPKDLKPPTNLSKNQEIKNI